MIKESPRIRYYYTFKRCVCIGGDGVFNLTPSSFANLEIIKAVLQPIWSPADTQTGTRHGVWKILRCRYLFRRVFYCFIYSSSSAIIRIMTWTLQEINVIKIKCMSSAYKNKKRSYYCIYGFSIYLNTHKICLWLW